MLKIFNKYGKIILKYTFTGINKKYYGGWKMKKTLSKLLSGDRRAHV